MNKKIDEILTTWHKHFEDEEYQYSEFESSDIEYFVGCLLYNHFSFSKAIATMKTIDLSYDFLESCGDEYEEILAKIKSIELSDDLEKLKFLQDFITESKSKYMADELYLLDRLENHVSGVFERTLNDAKVGTVEFIKPEIPTRSPNPLLR